MPIAAIKHRKDIQIRIRERGVMKDRREDIQSGVEKDMKHQGVYYAKENTDLPGVISMDQASRKGRGYKS